MTFLTSGSCVLLKANTCGVFKFSKDQIWLLLFIHFQNMQTCFSFITTNQFKPLGHGLL